MQVNLKALDNGGRVTNGFHKMKIDNLNQVLNTSKMGFGSRKGPINHNSYYSNEPKYAHMGKFVSEETQLNHEMYRTHFELQNQMMKDEMQNT